MSNGKEVRAELDSAFGPDNWIEGPEQGWLSTGGIAALCVALPAAGGTVTDARLREYGAFGLRAAAWAASKGRLGELRFGTRRITFYKKVFGEKVTYDNRAMLYAAFVPSS